MTQKGHDLRTDSADYRIVAPLAKGAFGLICEGRVVNLHQPIRRGHPPCGADVVIKLPQLPRGISYEEAVSHYIPILVNSYTTEAHAMQHLGGLRCVPRIHGVGIAPISLGFGSIRWSMPFIVMERLNGQTLGRYLADRFGTQGEFRGVRNATQFFKTAKPIVSSLLEIHRRQVVHGDIWPNNIMICDGQPRFIDFGQAVRRDLGPGSLCQKVGSHAYLAPDGSATVVGDVFAMAGVLFYMATGQNPPRGIANETLLKATVLAQIRAVNPELIDENRGIADIIARGLRHDRHRRLQTVDLMLDDIELFEQASIRKEPKGRRSISMHLRIHENKRHADALAGGIHNTFRSDDEISTWMTRLLSFLQPGDTYCTISVPRFWRQENVGPDGRFLSMNMVKAKHGIKIKRVFLLREKDLKDPEVIAMFRGQFRVIEELAGCPSRIANTPASHFYQVSYVMLSDAEYETAVTTYRHSGLIMAGGVGSVVFNSYNADGRITSSSLHPVPALYRTQMKAFVKFQIGSKPLMELKALIDPPLPSDQRMAS